MLRRMDVKMFTKTRSGWALVAIMSAILFIGGCSSTDSDTDKGSTLTFNLTLPPDSNLDGKTVQAGLWNSWGDSIAYKTANGTIDSITASIELTDIPDGTYQLLVVVDVGNDGFGENPVDPGDLFWGTLDLSINQNRIINLTRYYWQRMNSVVFGVQGIPSGNDGKVCGVGLFEPGTDVLGSGISNVSGGAAIIYNNSALIAINAPEGQDSLWQLPSDTYDIWSLVDIDGQPEDWFENEGNITEGDLIDSIVNWNYIQGDNDWAKFSFSYYTLTAANLDFSVTMPDGYALNGHQVYFTFWENWGDSIPGKLDSAVVTNNQASISIPFFVARSYQVMLVVDVDNSGSGDFITRGDLLWGVLDVTADEDETFIIPGAALQEFQSIVFGIDDIPYGHDAQPIGLGLVNDGVYILNRHERNLAGGVAMIYHNSAILAVNLSDNYPDSILGTGDYDIWFLIDVDGNIGNYEDSLYWPVTVNDLYYQHNYGHRAGSESYFNLIQTASFAAMVGVSGTVTCPTWVSGGGAVYVLLFNGDPLQDTLARELNWVQLSQPDSYLIPITQSTDLYAVGFWDADSSGSENGPTTGDLIGGYSHSGNVDSLIMINSGVSGQTGIDFELNTPYTSR